MNPPPPLCGVLFFLVAINSLSNSTLLDKESVHIGSASLDCGPAACELVSLMGSYTMPGQHSQPTPTLLAVSFHPHLTRQAEETTSRVFELTLRSA